MEVALRGAELEVGPTLRRKPRPTAGSFYTPSPGGGMQAAATPAQKEDAKGQEGEGGFPQTLVTARLSSSASNNDGNGPAGPGLRSNSQAGVRENAT